MEERWLGNNIGQMVGRQWRKDSWEAMEERRDGWEAIRERWLESNGGGMVWRQWRRDD
jgi:hypothetical protein